MGERIALPPRIDVRLNNDFVQRVPYLHPYPDARIIFVKKIPKGCEELRHARFIA